MGQTKILFDTHLLSKHHLEQALKKRRETCNLYLKGTQFCLGFTYFSIIVCIE